MSAKILSTFGEKALLQVNITIEFLLNLNECRIVFAYTGFQYSRTLSNLGQEIGRRISNVGQTIDPDAQFTKAIIQDYVKYNRAGGEGDGRFYFYVLL